MKHLIVIVFACGMLVEVRARGFLDERLLKQYIETFNREDEERYVQAIPNDEAFEFLRENIPLFECPDKNVERTYYFRWWTYRKHIRKTPYGQIITEFLPDVSWSANCNAIPCPGLFHFREGRWMRNPVFLKEYADFWLHQPASTKTKNGATSRPYWAMPSP